jgi:predicted HTH domain antitoxin
MAGSETAADVFENVRVTFMTVSFELPKDLEQHLRLEFGDLGQAAKEALLIESYREGRLSIGRIAPILGKGVIETQAWLADHGAPLNYSLEDLKSDRETLNRLFPETAR